MPTDVYPTAYSAYRMYFQDAPSDYENIYFYAREVGEIRKRFPENKKTISFYPYWRLGGIFIHKKSQIQRYRYHY